MMWIQTIRQWFSKAQSISVDKETRALPEPAFAYLHRQIQRLPHHPDYLSTIHTALDQALYQWRQDQVYNTLVVLASPTEDLPSILSQILSERQEDSFLKFHTLCPARDPSQPMDPIAGLELPPSDPHLILIPGIDRVFLRSIPGLEFLEQLIETIQSQPNCFWLMGCNDWTWQYLDTVCQFACYFNDPIRLPKLTGQQLRNWLAAVFQDLFLSWGLETSEDQEERCQRYFEDLSNTALGLSQVATHLWINSLRYPPADEEEQDQKDLLLSEITLRVKPAILPNLPALTEEDPFILYSLLLHDQITSDQLALTLAESVGSIRARIRALSQSGLLIIRQGQLQINPGYYPRIKIVLNNSNLLIPEQI